MKANLPVREPAVLAHWEEIDLYQRMSEQAKEQGRVPFVLHDGPPYANGDIHLGHAVNKTLKDIVTKLKWLSGYDAPYVPGWDCHGLPIELNVEKKVGKVGVDVSVADFRQACRDYAHSQVDNQREAFKRLGVLGDWDQPYLTMNKRYEANILRAMAKIIENGHLQRGYKPVHWCVVCHSALAEAEVEYRDKASPAIDVSFEVVDVDGLLTALKAAGHAEAIDSLNAPVMVPIWTTTPWTLPANQAVTVHPELEYDLVAAKHAGEQRYYIIASALLEGAAQRFLEPDYQVLTSFPGAVIERLLLQHPFLDRQVPVILGDHVTIDAGTGCVHTAPAHGQEDYVVGLKYDLPLDNPVDDRGCFVSQTPFVAGEHVFKANEQLIAVMQDKGVLLHHAELQHSYPHCWRHKKPLIFRATAQWFISMDQNQLRAQALEAIQSTEWMPAWGKERMMDMVAQRPDWCISRQRSWGTPLTLFMHKETDEIHPKSVAFMLQIADRVAQEGLDVWDSIEVADFLGDEAKDYQKTTDTLDVWFDSGVSHVAVLAERERLTCPADIYLEGSDQYRGWFQSSLLTAVAIHGISPYKACLTHGFTVDTKGHKMSKSLGNVVAPDEIIKQFGADVLRLWIASTNYRHEITVSDEIFQRSADAYRRLRNTARFLLANLCDFDPAKHLVKRERLLSLDRWLVGYAHRLQAQIQADYAQYQFHQVSHRLQRFCSVDLGGFYLDVVKDRQYTMQTDSIGRRSAQTAMYHLLEVLVRCFAPILSFTAEEIWQHMPGERAPSVFLVTWYEALSVLEESDAMNQAFGEQLMRVRDEVNKRLEAQRNAGAIGSALDADVRLYCDGSLFEQLSGLDGELRFVLITSSAEVLPEKDRLDDSAAVETEIPGLHVAVRASAHEKCGRCWHRRASVGSDPVHPDLCDRCVENVSGKGEERLYA